MYNNGNSGYTHNPGHGGNDSGYSNSGSGYNNSGYGNSGYNNNGYNSGPGYSKKRRGKHWHIDSTLWIITNSKKALFLTIIPAVVEIIEAAMMVVTSLVASSHPIYRRSVA